MPKFDKQSVFQKIQQTGVVPVFYQKDIEVAKKIIKACYDGGIRVFEFTNRGDFAHEVFAECVKYASTDCPEMAIGVGSIVDASTAALYMQLGACFVVGPLFNPDVAKVCNRRLVPYIPGCGTVSEIGFAHECGCDIVKAFPGDVCGPAFVKSILAPCPWSKIMVTGGVSPTNESITEWVKSGAFCVGIGSKLFPKSIVEEEKWQSISENCANAIKSYLQARNLQ